MKRGIEEERIMARILICDDAAFMRQALIKLLKEEHEIVAEAADGRECIEQYVKTVPEIVLMDITMPDMDGIEATKKIVEIDPKAKIIMVSAMGQQDKVLSAIAAGAKDFIVKPFEPERIKQCIQRYL